MKRVADFWTSGDGERARNLPASEFNEILGLVLAQEQGQAIALEEEARESKRQDTKTDLRALSLAGG